MSRHRVKWAISFVFVLALCTSLHARRERWEYLGEAHVDGSQDHDSIKVGRSAGTYGAIQLPISGGAINFERVIDRYGNGSQEEIAIRSRIKTAGKPASSICPRTAHHPEPRPLVRPRPVGWTAQSKPVRT
jgi:hypothetical protein